MGAASAPYILCWALFCSGLALYIEMDDAGKLGPSGSTGFSQWLANASNAVNEAISTATASSQSGRRQKLRKASDAITGTAKSPEREEDAVTSSFVTEIVASGLQAAMKVIGQATEARFQQVEASVAIVKQDRSAMRSGVDDFQKDTTNEIQALKGQLAAWEANESARQADADRVREEALAALEEAKKLHQ